MTPRARTAPRRWILAALCLTVGTTAIAGGITLVARPDGSLLQLPVSVLRHSPFSGFLIPGLILLVIVGFTNLVAGVMVARDAPAGNAAAFCGGLALLGWIVTQLLLLRTVEGLQVCYLLAALAILAEANHRRSRRPPRSQLDASPG